jgi:hypothetical protein
MYRRQALERRHNKTGEGEDGTSDEPAPEGSQSRRHAQDPAHRSHSTPLPPRATHKPTAPLEMAYDLDNEGGKELRIPVTRCPYSVSSATSRLRAQGL